MAHFRHIPLCFQLCKQINASETQNLWKCILWASGKWIFVMPYKWGSDLFVMPYKWGQVKCCDGHAKRINLWPSLLSGLCIFKTHNDCLFIVLTCRIIDRINIYNCKRRKSPDFFLTFTFLSLNWKSTEVLFAGLMEENSVSSIGKIQLEYSKHYHISLCILASAGWRGSE